MCSAGDAQTTWWKIRNKTKGSLSCVPWAPPNQSGNDAFISLIKIYNRKPEKSSIMVAQNIF